MSEEELERTFAGVARNVRPGGFFIFDLNSLAVYETLFSRNAIVATDEALFCWRGSGEPDVEPGATCEATIEIFSENGGECWAPTSSRHLQRHHDPALIRELLPVAGFELVELYGQVTGARLEQPVDEERHLKLVYLCRRAQTEPAPATGGG